MPFGNLHVENTGRALEFAAIATASKPYENKQIPGNGLDKQVSARPLLTFLIVHHCSDLTL
jgi:hypothetical protein